MRRELGFLVLLDRVAGTLVAQAVKGALAVNMVDKLQSAGANTNGRRTVYSPAGEVTLKAQTLREIVTRHCVCYEVWPEWSGSGGRASRIGFALSVCGIHENGPTESHAPACPHCWRTYTALRAVAEWIRPEEERKCRFEIAAYDRAWHVAPNARHARNETLVTIKIFHRNNVDAPIDECQQECLNHMRQKLTDLGVRENVWAGS